MGVLSPNGCTESEWVYWRLVFVQGVDLLAVGIHSGVLSSSGTVTNVTGKSDNSRRTGLCT